MSKTWAVDLYDERSAKSSADGSREYIHRFLFFCDDDHSPTEEEVRRFAPKSLEGFEPKEPAIKRREFGIYSVRYRFVMPALDVQHDVTINGQIPPA